MNKVQGENPNEQAGESRGQNVSKGSITSLWTYVKEFPVWRVFQDDDRLVVFRDNLGQCFVTFPNKGVNFPVSYRLTLERLDENLYRYRDSRANKFRVMTDVEVNALRWKGIPVVFYPVAMEDPTAKPSDSAFHDETVILEQSRKQREPTFSDWTMGRGSRVEVNEPLQGVRPELRTTYTNPSLKMRPSNEPKPSPFLQDLDLLLEPNTYRNQVLEREP